MLTTFWFLTKLLGATANAWILRHVQPPLLMTIYTYSSSCEILVVITRSVSMRASVATTTFVSVDALWWSSSTYKLPVVTVRDIMSLDGKCSNNRDLLPRWCLYGRLQRGEDPLIVLTQEDATRQRSIQEKELRPGSGNFVAGCWEIRLHCNKNGFLVASLMREGQVQTILYEEEPFAGEA